MTTDLVEPEQQHGHSVPQRQAQISVVVPHYGDPAPAAQLIGQLLAQVDAPPFEVIVVDDASPQPFTDAHLPRTAADRTAAAGTAAAGIADDCPATASPATASPAAGRTAAGTAADRPVAAGPVATRVIRRERNGGFGAAVNTGAAAAEGEYLLVLNSDLSIEPGFIAALTESAAPWQPAVASPHVQETSGRSGWAGRHFPRSRHYAVEWLGPLARFRQLPALHEAVGHDTRAVAGATVAVDWVAGAAILIPLAELRTVGGFDEGYHMYMEEVDLQRRLRARGVPSVYLGNVRVEHVGGGSSDSQRRRRWLVSARLRYARKWGEHPTGQRLALTAATLVNFAANLPRQALGREVDAVGTCRHELDLVWGRQ